VPASGAACTVPALRRLAGAVVSSILSREDRALEERKMISPETHVQIRRYFYAEHWKIGTIARELSVHPDAVRNAIESDRFNRTQSIRPSVTDPSNGVCSPDPQPASAAARHAHLSDDP
jgi:hypothetical protein